MLRLRRTIGEGRAAGIPSGVDAEAVDHSSCHTKRARRVHASTLVMRNAATARSMKLSLVFSGSPILPQNDASPCAKRTTGLPSARPARRSVCECHATATSASSATTPSRSMQP